MSRPSRPFRFVKMHGCGNDFVIVDERVGDTAPRGAAVRAVCNRRFGVGCDQLLILSPPRAGGDAAVDIYNADGSAAEQCGNGMRCLAWLVAARNGKIEPGEVVLETGVGALRARVLGDGRVSVNLGQAQAGVHRGADGPQDQTFDLASGERTWTVSSVSLGNPHAVVEVDEAGQAPLARLAALLDGHWQFPDGVNLGVCQVLGDEHLQLRVFERGAGETLACGSGACAAVVAMHARGRCRSRCRVSQPGGDLVVELAPDGVHLSGPVQYVFDGHWHTQDRAPDE